MTTSLRFSLIHAPGDEGWAREFRECLIRTQDEAALKEVDLERMGGERSAGKRNTGRLESTDMVFLLLSPEAFTERWGMLHRVLEQHDLGYVLAIPIVLRSCLWKASPLKRLEALPKDDKPVSEHPDRQRVWSQISEQLNLGAIATHMFYKRLAAKGLEALQTGAVEQISHFDDPGADSRLGVTLKVSIPQQVGSAFARIIQRMKRFAPEHLYYEAPQFHFTILSLITAHEDFVLSEVPVNKARRTMFRFSRSVSFSELS